MIVLTSPAGVACSSGKTVFLEGLLAGYFIFFNNMKEKQTITKYSQLVMPQDSNVIGTLFGGQMVSWMDIAAAKAAHRYLRNSNADAAVTRAIDAIEFTEPVHVGDWVNFNAKIIRKGLSSIVIKVEAFKETKNQKQKLACAAIFTMVSVKKQGNGIYQKVEHKIN